MTRRILIVSPYYHPGRDAGGPIKSLKNVARFLLERGRRVEVVTKDRDFGAATPFPGIATDRWVESPYGTAWYSSSMGSTIRGLRDACRPKPDAPLLYLNSFCSFRFSILPVLLAWLGLIKPARILIAPRGEFVPSALAHKPRRKRVYLRIAKFLGLYRGVTWHVTNAQEEAFTRALFGAGARVGVAPNIGDVVKPSTVAHPPKAPGTLRIAFVARIIRIKNLHVALEALSRARASVIFDVYGPREDAAYVEACERIAAGLPSNVTVRWMGVVESDKVCETLGGYDLFWLPSQGENFGHAILEAMQAGCPVLISDKTPWRGLREANAGWDLPSDDPAGLVQALEEMAALDESAWMEKSRAVRRYLGNHPLVRDVDVQNESLFA